MLLKDFLANAPDHVHQFFAGHNPDHHVRVATAPGEVQVVVEDKGTTDKGEDQKEEGVQNG